MAARGFKSYVNEFLPEFGQIQYRGSVPRNVLTLVADLTMLGRVVKVQQP